jgi:peptidase S41-like protein
MKRFSTSAAGFAMLAAVCFAQTTEPKAPAKPTPTPAPTPKPAAAATPSPTPKVQIPAAEKPAAPAEPRTAVDALPQDDVKEAIGLLKSNYLNPALLTDQEIERATLQGLLERIAPGGSILDAPGPRNSAPSPFRSEIIDGRIGYARLGSLSKSALDELDSALQNFTAKPLKSAIVDLRATPPGNEFDLAAEVIKRFCPKGKILFTLKRPSAKQEQVVTSNQDPRFRGLIVVLADKDAAGAAEVIAEALRAHANAMIVGQKTAGRAAEFADLPLKSGKVLHVAVGEVTLPENASIFPQGVKPDLAVEVSTAAKREVMRQALESGVSPLVFESERPRMNEASLVAGTNPELDAIQAAQRGKTAPKAQMHDVVLQRAIDLITSIGIYESKSRR